MKKYIILGMFIIICITATLYFLPKYKTEDTKKIINTTTLSTSTTNTINNTTTKANMELQKPQLTIDKNKKYTAIMKTEVGEIELELFADKTPITVNNFVYLSENGFYKNVIFHRTIPGFMIQGGDPTGTGRGGPGYKFDDESFTGTYKKGILAMANSGKNTNGSQFFIMHGDTPLQPNYVIFGNVIKGLDIVDKIASAPTIKDGMENSKPQSPIKILDITIKYN